MASLGIEGGELVLHLSGVEKVEGVHGDIRVPVSSVRAIEVLEDAHRPAGISAGLKVGTRIPGVVEVGTIRRAGRKIFVAVHHDTPRGVRICLEGADHDEWIVGCADPGAVVAGLSLPR